MSGRLALRIRIAVLLTVAIAVASSVDPQPAPGRRRALLIGINDYTASRLGRPRTAPPPGRDWPNLSGAVNDVGLLREMLVLLHGFERRNIVTLTDQGATRAAMLEAIDEHLVKPAAKGDVLFFYYAGHGSQVRNSLSDEPDRLDESLVPADSRLGARDIRDKELRRLFNRILDRGARLTVILDACHSGSGARGLSTGVRHRGVRRDDRDVADSAKHGPRPEDRGALVLSAAQDYDTAWEKRDDEGKMHGAFSWAWIRAMRDASARESAEETFLRAQARLRAETPFQEPVLAGNAEARFNPFLGVRTDRRGDRTVVGVERIQSDGTVLLQGGWANGLSVGSELRVLSDDARLTSRLTITKILGPGQSAACIETGRTLPQEVRSGALLEVVGWATPPGRALRVWTPRVSGNVEALAALARRLSAEAAQRRVRWISDPTDVTPEYLLRRGARDWELVGPSGDVERLGPDPSDAVSAVVKMHAGASLFVQLPAPSALIDGIAIGPGTDREGIDLTDRPDEADYILAGRFSKSRVEYAWVRPLVRSGDRRKTGLPLHTTWIAEDGRDDTLRDSVLALRESVERLRKIHAWQLLESPPEMGAPYRLALRRARDGELVTENVVSGEGTYHIVLRSASPLPTNVPARYYYVFTIDSHGKSFLAFPQSGSVENRFPIGPAAPEITLGESGSIEIRRPYGVDTFFLLTTDEPLPNPWILELGSSARAPSSVTPGTWSIEKVMYESVAPRKSSKKRSPKTPQSATGRCLKDDLPPDGLVRDVV